MKRWLALAPFLLFGCEASETPPAADGPDPAETARLLALGYLDYAEEAADPSRMRVVEIDPARSQPGYRLYCTRGRAIAELIDHGGRPVRAWDMPDSLELMSCRLLENGDLVVVGILRPKEGSEENEDSDRYLARYAFDGRLLWRKPLPVHHDVSPTPDGNLATLGLRYRVAPAVHERVPIRDDQMLLVDPEGNLLAERSLYDALASAPERVRILPRVVQTKWKREQVDLLHANTIEWMQHTHLFGRAPLHAEGNVLVTLRHQNLVAVVAWESNRLVWAWGQDDLIEPHEATVLPSGNLLIFDNGGERGFSRVIELDPLKEEIVWEYRAARPADFFTASRGGSRRLPNGNTLITNSNNAYAFEVTPGGETVWKFMSPHLNEEGRRLTFRRMSWYPASIIDAIRAHR